MVKFTSTKRLIISALIGLAAEAYPVPGAIVAMFTVNIHSNYGMAYIYVAYIANFLIVTGAVYGVWSAIARRNAGKRFGQ